MSPIGCSSRPTDVSIEPDVEALVALAVESFGRLDVMFNNAGIGGAFGPITELEVDDWDATFAVNTRSVFLGIKYAARVMIAQGDGGSIINTASVAGLSGGGGPQAYSAAKAAVINLTQSAAVELAPHRIRVNAICPGAVYTDLLHRGDPKRPTSGARTSNRGPTAANRPTSRALRRGWRRTTAGSCRAPTSSPTVR